MSKQKTLLLGENFSTAAHKLRKAIMFSLIQELNRDICHRCTLKIDSINELSIEHIESWQSAKNPSGSFYDLKNIAFSHLSCNSSAAHRKKKYATDQERRAVQWSRYYSNKKDQILERKRDRYHRNMAL